MGNGELVYSTSSTGAYDTASGTSFAAPNVAGVSALLVEHYGKLHGGSNSRSATTKAVLIHSAFDAGNAGPDYQFGWGLVDAAEAANVLSDSAQVFPTAIVMESTYTGQNWDLTVWSDSDSSTPLKATIVWADPAPTNLPGPGLDDATSVLVNDLDLSVAQGGTSPVFLPWTLNPANPNALAVRTQRNDVDNVEQVLIDTPQNGTAYTIRIRRDPGQAAFTQDFSLIVTGIEPLGQTRGAPIAVSRTPAYQAADSTLDGIDVQFSEAVVGVDATDLVLTGPGATGAVVGTPQMLGSADRWRFPVSGLTATGQVNLSLAPDLNDVEDPGGNDLRPRPTSWSFDVVTSLPKVAHVRIRSSANNPANTLNPTSFLAAQASN